MQYLDITTEAAGDQADQLEAVMSREAAIRRIVALHAPGLRAEIREKRALRYGTEPGSASGIASHVRAASAIRRQGSRLIVIQDDVNALAVIDASSCIMPLLLPPAADGRRSCDADRYVPRLTDQRRAASSATRALVPASRSFTSTAVATARS